MKARTILFASILSSALSFSCGGGGSSSPGTTNPGTNPGGTNPGTNPGATPAACTVTISGDATSGIQGATFPCGSIVSAVRDLGATVEVITVTGGTTNSFILMGTAADLTNHTPIVNITFTGFPTLPTTMTESTPAPAVVASVQYAESPFNLPTIKSWGANNGTPNGSFTAQLTSVTSAATTDCTAQIGTITQCFHVHGTIHAVMPPDNTFSNHAVGTATMDVTF